MLSKEQNILINKFNDEGYLIVESVLSNNECEKFKNITKYIYPRFKNKYATSKKKTKHGLNDKSQEEIIFNLHNKDFAFIELLTHSASIPLISHILKEGSYEFCCEKYFTWLS